MSGLLSPERKLSKGLLGAPSARMELALPPTAGMPSAAGIGALGLTPQEMYLYEHHVGNVAGGAAVNNGDGSTSTLRQMSVEGPGGLTYNVPTVWDGKIVSGREAVKRAAAVGWDRWPSYASPDEAEARYAAMHQYLEQDVP